MIVKIDEKRVGLRRKLILNNIEFSIQPGQSMLILGESGSGKSTLMACLRGDKFKGRIIGADSYRYVPQDIRISKEGLVQDLICGKLRCLGYSVYEAKQNANNMLMAFGIADLASNRISTLSGGQLKRLQLAYCLSDTKNYEMALIDECDSSLDMITAMKIQQALNLFNKRQRKIMLQISHHIEDRNLLLYNKILVLKKISKESESNMLYVGAPEKLRCLYNRDFAYHILQEEGR